MLCCAVISCASCYVNCAVLTDAITHVMRKTLCPRCSAHTHTDKQTQTPHTAHMRLPDHDPPNHAHTTDRTKRSYLQQSHHCFWPPGTTGDSTHTALQRTPSRQHTRQPWLSHCSSSLAVETGSGRTSLGLSNPVSPCRSNAWPDHIPGTVFVHVISACRSSHSLLYCVRFTRCI